MKPYSFHIIAEIIEGKILQEHSAQSGIDFLATDSRKILHPASSLFFALKTAQANGHSYIKSCYEKGVRAFIISDSLNLNEFPGAGFIRVTNTLRALQKLAAHHRTHFNEQRKTNNEKRTTIPVIGITGSNGKTIVKEWLYQLLQADYQIVRSPKSYNSQIGVPLSVWQLNEHHDLAIFEAGISQKGEMKSLADIIQPTIGVFTFLGEAHNEGFSDKQEKVLEKCKLFDKANTIIYPSADLRTYLPKSIGSKTCISWGYNEDDDLKIIHETIASYETIIQVQWKNKITILHIPFTDKASIHNALTCCCVCLHLGMQEEALTERMQKLEPVGLRLDIKKGIQGCTLLNDAYAADLNSLEIAIHLLLQQSGEKTIVLSDFILPENEKSKTYHAIGEMISHAGIKRIITVGEDTKKYLNPLLSSKIKTAHFDNTDALIQQIPPLHFFNEAILIKGARKFELERLLPYLEQQVHETLLEINLSAIAANLTFIKGKLKSDTKIMAVVKAFSYGSGSYEIARLLQYHRVDYLAVAFIDEGVALRKAGIELPILVMSPDTAGFEALTAWQLEPEIYSFSFLDAFTKHLEKESLQDYPVHIKIDTGMHRLGFMENEWKQLAEAIRQNEYLSIKSVFSHLVASEDEVADDFTILQGKQFDKACKIIQDVCSYSFFRHLNNTSGILRHPELQYEMVRLGIGLYGSGTTQKGLEPAIRFVSSIAQIRELPEGETVGYNRKGVLTRRSKIATVRVGYADGFPRNLSNGKGWMIVRGQKAPVIGSVCMDMTMLDVTDIHDVSEGDTVEIFGASLTADLLAKQADTIAYEILTGISQRVKRVYFEE